VAFFAVAAGDTLADAKKYVGQTRMAMPAFADALGLMEARYGQQISRSNIHQTRVIDPTGKIVEYRFDEASIEKALEGAQWKFRDEADDLYARAAAAFRNAEPGTAAAGVKALGEDKSVKAELAARKALARVQGALARATPEQKGEVAKVCHDIVKKHPGTPTADKARSLAEELGQPVPQ
jgi:hypothetical protein